MVKKMERRRMKGQFFLIFAFMLIIMFYIGISVYLSPPGVSETLSNDIDFIIRNIENEYPVAFNIGLNESDGIGRTTNFTVFARGLLNERNIDMYSILFFTESVGSNVNVTVANYLEGNEYVSVGISGDDRILYIQNGSVNSTVFANPSDVFTLDITFNSIQKNLLLGKYKSNLYFYTELKKGYDIIVGGRKT